MKRIALILLSAALGFGLPPAETMAQSNPKLLAQGRDILDRNCSRCHAIDKTGESTHAKAPPFRIVATRYPAETLAEALAEGIVSGHPDMPEFVFEPPEVDAIIAYLDSLAPQSKK